MSDIGLFDAIYSQRSITRYKPDPVPKEAIEKIIEAATRAPSGGNTQPWHFVAITDRDLVFPDRWDLSRQVAGASGYGGTCRRTSRLPGRPLPGRSHAGGPGTDPRLRGGQCQAIPSRHAGPARGLGLGTRLTTTHTQCEQEIKDILGLPDYVETVALTPLGYPRGRFGPTDRRPASEVTSWNRWGGS